MTLREFLYNNNVSSNDYDAINNYLRVAYPDEKFIFGKSLYGGITIVDLMEFINSPQPQQNKDVYALLQETNIILKQIRDEITRISDKREQG